MSTPFAVSQWREEAPVLEEDIGHGYWIKIRPVLAGDPYRRPRGFDVTVGTSDMEFWDRLDMKSFPSLGMAYLAGSDLVRRRMS